MAACEYVLKEHEGNRIVCYCTFGTHRNDLLGLRRDVKVRIDRLRSLACPWTNCPHVGEVTELHMDEKELEELCLKLRKTE